MYVFVIATIREIFLEIEADHLDLVEYIFFLKSDILARDFL